MSRLSDNKYCENSNDIFIPAERNNINSLTSINNSNQENVSILCESIDDNDQLNCSGENINSTEFFSEIMKNITISKNKNFEDKNNIMPSTSKIVNLIDNKSNDLSKEINELLLQGETGSILSKQNNEEDSDEDYEVKSETNCLISQKEIQIYIPKDNFIHNTKRSKQQELNKLLKDKFNQKVRSSQIYIHKVGLLCWLSHGFFLNGLLNDPEVLKIALSIISSNNYPKNQIDLQYIKKFTKWFIKMFEICEKHKHISYTKDLLIQRFKEKKIYNYKEIILLYIAVVRGMGINCRLVISLQPPMLKPKPEQLFKFVTMQEEKKNFESEKHKIIQCINKNNINSSDNNEISESKFVKTISKSERNLNDKIIIPENSFEAMKIRKLINKKQAVTHLKKKTSDNSFKKDKKMSKNENSIIKNDYDIECESKLSIAKKLYLKTDESEKKLKNKSETYNSLKKRCKSNNKSYEKTTDISIDVKDRDKNLNNKISNNKFKKLLSSDEDNANILENKYNTWVEVYIESEEFWTSVDILNQTINSVSEIYEKVGNPVLYVVAWNSDGRLKDVTRRYCPNWLINTRKKRVDEKWWNETLLNWQEEKTVISKAEDEQLLKRELQQPLPKTLTECKGHPLYVLTRHLLKFEALYPPDVVPLGYLKTGEAIYSRHCVHTLFSRETWIRKARVVKPLQEAYKIVKSMPKYDKLSGIKVKNQPLELFGKWQTSAYIPPEAKDGKVPRNEYGNVDLFKKCMLPKGTVHINLPALNRIARKLNIDCAQACVGFNFGCRGAVPTFEGFVICKEYEDTLRDAWEQEQIESETRLKVKHEKKIYGNWKKLIKGLLIRERLAMKYNFKGEK